MIGSLRGFVLWSKDNEACVEVNGVGYMVKFPSVSTLSKVVVDDESGEVLVFTYHVIREDSQSLYGFCNPAERSLFGVLLSVSGVGPGLALAMLGMYDPSQLARIVKTENVAMLVAVPGVGRKTAELLMIKLKNKSDIFDSLSDNIETETDDRGDTGAVHGSGPSQGAMEALAGLGFTPVEAAEMLKSAPEFDTPEEVLRWALRR